MALLSAHRIEQLFGAQMPIANVSGSVDGSTHVVLIENESVVLNLIPYGTVVAGVVGNFICREGSRIINGQPRQVQTVGWMTPQGRLINLGSMYKRDHLNNTNPANVGLPTSTVNRAELLPLLDGGTITVGVQEKIQVKTFGWFEDHPTLKEFTPATRYGFTFVPKV